MARPTSSIPRLRLAASATAILAALALAAALPARAEASPSQFSIMQDDNQLVYGTDAQRERALTIMKALGVDTVRVTVLWSFVAPKQALDDDGASNPDAYPRGRISRFDKLVDSAQRRGIDVQFNVTGPGPRWTQATSKDKALQRGYKPDTRAYGFFVEALARRYSGGYEDRDGGRLPRVSSWSFWNEPNFPSWITPQSEPSRRLNGKLVPVAPAIYRELAVAGAKALLRTGHSGDLVSIGETAPLGSDASGPKRSLRPTQFARELFCLDGALRPYRGEAAKARRCDRVRKLKVLGALPRLAWGHHPYTQRLSPNSPNGERGSITLANINALPKLLDRIALARPGTLRAGVPILLTEFGYETEPDPFAGISLAKQTGYINEGDYTAFRNPRIAAVTQFQLDDVPPDEANPVGSRRYWRTYQSGLYDLDGHPKPSAGAYAFPFAMSRVGDQVEFWGQLRFLPNGTQTNVQIQIKTGSEFANFGPPLPVTNANGFFATRAAVPGGTVWRAVWVAPNGEDVAYSRQTTVP